jgi:hypothetical protein
MRAPRGLVAASLLVLLGACGGQPEPPTAPLTAFAGEYGAFGMQHVFDVVPDVRAQFGVLTSNGTTSVSGRIDENDNGTIFLGFPGTSGFTLDDDGTLHLRADATEYLRGHLATDGRVAFLGSVLAGEDPVWLALVRRWAGTASDATLSGAYHVISFREGSDVVSAVGAASFDGAGAGFVAAGSVENAEGTIGVDPFGTFFTYDVAADGTTTLEASAISTFVGGIVEGSDLLVLSGSTTLSGDPQTLAFLRAATTATDATLDGQYAVVGGGYRLGGNVFYSLTGTLTADGAGALTIAATYNAQTVVSTPIPQNATYTVASDGRLTVTPTGATLRGAVSEDGRFALIGGGVTPFSDSLFFLCFRK